jgi:ElaB/YqjD/DUF883 family membrane-anchored ribosome-binding protein
MALTKAQIAKLQSDLKKAQSNLKKARAVAKKSAPAPRAANDYLGLGPVGGLGAGAIAGVNAPAAPANV